jgi:hypothetical protein
LIVDGYDFVAQSGVCSSLKEAHTYCIFQFCLYFRSVGLLNSQEVLFLSSIEVFDHLHHNTSENDIKLCDGSLEIDKNTKTVCQPESPSKDVKSINNGDKASHSEELSLRSDQSHDNCANSRLISTWADLMCNRNDNDTISKGCRQGSFLLTNTQENIEEKVLAKKIWSKADLYASKQLMISFMHECTIDFFDENLQKRFVVTSRGETKSCAENDAADALVHKLNTAVSNLEAKYETKCQQKKTLKDVSNICDVDKKSKQAKKRKRRKNNKRESSKATQGSDISSEKPTSSVMDKCAGGASSNCSLNTSLNACNSNITNDEKSSSKQSAISKTSIQ